MVYVFYTTTSLEDPIGLSGQTLKGVWGWGVQKEKAVIHFERVHFIL